MAKEQGLMFMHCRRCLQELPDGESPREWARLSVSFTKEGLQVFCTRHDLNVVHIHFEGQQHPAVMDDEGLFTAPKKEVN